MRLHGRISTYNDGCRCDECRSIATFKRQRNRHRGGNEVDERTLFEQAQADRARRIARGLIRVAQERPDWYDNAACKGHTALMFPDASHVGAGGVERVEVDGRAMCAACPVRVPCRDQGRADREFGIWGGESEYDRARLGIVPKVAHGKLHKLRRDGSEERTSTTA